MQLHVKRELRVTQLLLHFVLFDRFRGDTCQPWVGFNLQ
jgi:hypothetical protein